jgi:diguanylate cyclase (GGDEF)-like protein
MAPRTVPGNPDTAEPAPARWTALPGALAFQARLYLAFSAVLGLVIVSAIMAILWIRGNDSEVMRRLAVLDFARRQSTVIDLELMTMSNALQAYLLDNTNRGELDRRQSADRELDETIDSLNAVLPTMPSVLRPITELKANDTDIVDPIEEELIVLSGKDVESAKHFYKTDYIPAREHEAELMQVLREEVARVEDAVQAKASRTRVRQLIVSLLAVVAITIVSGLLAWLSARAIGNQIRTMTNAMGKLADGDTTIAIPARDRRDEIGAMARAVDVFRANLIARRASEATVRRINLQFDAALNSMLHGMIVWGPDQRVQLVNRRFYAIAGMPEGCIAEGLAVPEVADLCVRHGLHVDEKPIDVAANIAALLQARRSMQVTMEMRRGQFIHVATEPMANGGAVFTFEDVTEKRQSEAQIIFMARHDALTGLPNRTLFQERMAAMLENGAEIRPCAVLCLDLDHFKEVNDTLGHPAGDELLRLVAARLRHCARDQDLIARLGGDEFAIIVGNPDGRSDRAAALAARIVEAVGAPYEVQGRTIGIGVSIGIALSESNISGADMLKRADVALYRAKEHRNGFVFFEPGMDELLKARLGMESDLRLALHRDEFELNYQPLYNLAEERVTGFEALLRWNSPTRGHVLPAEFIPLAEQSGLIVPIGEWVLRTACAEAARWPDHVRVAVNLSPVQTKDQHLVALVRQTLAATGLPPHRLELEITETVLLQDTDAVMSMLHTLHGMGVRIAMDDFGTGYSSLSYLRRFPFDKIKIDRSFISDLRDTQDGSEDGAPDGLSAVATSAATIVRAIVGLGANLGISTTAEGVETAQQFERVRQKGCTEVQGYFVSPPRPAGEVLELLRRLDTTLPAIAGRSATLPQLVA